MSQYTINDTCSNNANLSNVLNHTAAADRAQLLTWLSPREPKLRHRDIQERRVKGVGEWFPQSEEFRSWYDRSEGEGGSTILFCHGDPGVGKKFISSLVVDSLCDQVGGQNAAVACFYFDFAARKEQSAARMMGSLLRQIVSGMERIPEVIFQAFERRGSALGERGPRLPDTVKMLQTITSSRPTFICIDALDECTGAQRVKILNSLKRILGESSITRMFITGRPHIRADIEKRFPGCVRSLSIGTRKDGVIRYLRAKLDEDQTPEAMDESLEVDILKNIPENISNTFLLVSLNVDAILQESTIHRRRERLGKITQGSRLEDYYGATIERIEAQGGDKARLGIAALMWINHAEQPLQPNELCYALAVELGSPEFNASNVPSMSTLVSCCQGLITVDKEASVVRLIHFTLKEYLSAHPDIFSRPHSTMAEICLTYLNSQHVKALRTGPYRDILDTPFLEYCSRYWGVHMKREFSDCAKSLALKLSQADHVHVPTAFLLGQLHFLKDANEFFSPFGGLHCASFLGIVEIVAALIEAKCCDTNGEDFWGRTPLAWAAHNGHDEVVTLLLEQGEINPDMEDICGQTPLSLAAAAGRDAVVRILLGREDVTPDKRDDKGQIPLSLAASGGHGGTVKLLLEREEVYPNNPDRNGLTALSWAAMVGHEEVVKMLLGQEKVYPNYRDFNGRTPLSWAASAGHAGVVKILVEWPEVNSDHPDSTGRTPLSWAASAGHAEVVKILLGCKKVNPDNPDSVGRTPLSWAASAGHVEVVEILLGSQAVNPENPDNNGGIPLVWAASAGHEGVVKLLLGQAVAKPNWPDAYGRTPLSLAAENGHAGVVRLILAREEVDPDVQDICGQTPLLAAAAAGHEEVVKILLAREEVNPDKPDEYGRTPLSFAARRGYAGVVKILLGRDVNPGRPDIRDQTPLSYATMNDHQDVVALLQSGDSESPITA